MNTDEYPTQDNPKRIGQINGPFAVLFKLALMSYPIVFGAMFTGGIWLITNVMELKQWKEMQPKVLDSELRTALALEREAVRREREYDLGKMSAGLLASLSAITVRQEAMQLAQGVMRDTLADIRADLRTVTVKQKEADLQLRDLWFKNKNHPAPAPSDNE